jgi:hypothetical protein
VDVNGLTDGVDHSNDLGTDVRGHADAASRQPFGTQSP